MVEGICLQELFKGYSNNQVLIFRRLRKVKFITWILFVSSQWRKNQFKQKNEPKKKQWKQDFILAEEDKTNEASIQYWFRCVDFDSDGFISAFELEHLYEEQISRMKQVGIEIVSFHDFFCQR